MRLCIKISASKFPLSYGMLVSSLIKMAIESSDKDYFNNLYYHEGKKNKKTKPFTFATRFSNFDIKLEEQVIVSKGDIKVYISTSDYIFFTNLYNGLIRINQEVKYKEFSYTICGISRLKEKLIKENEVLFKAISPLVIKDKKGEFISPDNEEYEEEFNYTANMILENLRGNGLKEPLKFTKVIMKKRVIKEEIQGFKDEANKRFLYVTGYEGLFKLIGNKDDLQFLYESGISVRRNQGAGYIEVIS